ncbi:hypothetical protein P4O66_011601 [Electrophorus voltai]|uniref:Uncharacterized protein n=1 Tax=Electrophorus voltai TaxID=2609070 RepID=A0AAD9DS48_9TELE|nr:hypothetical protein P4O66_011601 [Electrophorus voltai]
MFLFYVTHPRILLCLLSVTETQTDEGCLGRGAKEGKERKQTPIHNPRRETLHHPGLTPYSYNRGGGHWWILGGGWVWSRPQPDYGEQYVEDQYSAGSKDPYMDYYEGYADYGGRGECSDISLRLDLGFDYVEDLSMEVEEVLYGDPLTDSDVESVISRSDEPPAHRISLKTPSRRCRWRASKPSHAAHIEATSFEEETPSTTTHSPGAHAPLPKPCRGKKELTPMPIPKTGKVAGAPPEMGQQKLPPPKSARDNPPQAGWTSAQPATAGQPGALAGLPGLFTNPLCSFVTCPCHCACPHHAVCASHLVPLCVGACACQCVFLCVYCRPGLCAAHVGSLGPSASPFGVGFRAVARKAVALGWPYLAGQN